MAHGRWRTEGRPWPTVATWSVVLSPLVWLPGGYSRFVLPKLLLVVIAIGVATLAPERGRWPRSVWIAFAAFGALFVGSALLGATPWASMVGRWPRYEGVPAVATYAGAAWVATRALDPRDPVGQIQRPVAWLAIGLAVASVLDVLGLPLTGHADRARDGAVLGNATDQGVVAMLAVLVLVLPAVQRRRPLAVAAVAAALVALVLSGSRASVLVALIALVVLALLRQRAGRLVLAAAAVLLLLGAALPQLRSRIGETYPVGTRLLQWEQALRVVGDHPVVGIGPSRYVDVVPRYETLEWARRAGVDQIADSAHSLPLQALVAGGIPLLVALGGVGVVVLRLGVQAVRVDPDRLGLLVAVVACGVVMLVNFSSAGTACLTAFLIGALVTEPVTEGGRPSPWADRLVAGGAGVMTVAIAMACIGEVATGRGAASDDAAPAVAAFERAETVRPWDPDTSMIASGFLARLASNGAAPAADPAVRAADRSLSRTPESCESLVALGVGQVARGRLVEAERPLDRAARLCPLRPQAYTQRAIARFGQGDVVGARHDLRRAIRIAPQDPAPRRILREIRRRVGPAD